MKTREVRCGACDCDMTHFSPVSRCVLHGVVYCRPCYKQIRAEDRKYSKKSLGRFYEWEKGDV